MKVLIDTNIILDILLARIPFIVPSVQLVQMIENGQIKAYVTANSITDIVYVARKKFSFVEIRRIILDLLNQINIIGVYREDILEAFNLGFSDFEDALQSACSEKEQIDFIVTRNKKDFTNSKVTALDIADFLAKYYR